MRQRQGLWHFQEYDRNTREIKSCYHTCHKGQEEIWQCGKLVREMSAGCANSIFRVARSMLVGNVFLGQIMPVMN